MKLLRDIPPHTMCNLYIYKDIECFYIFKIIHIISTPTDNEIYYFFLSFVLWINQKNFINYVVVAFCLKDGNLQFVGFIIVLSSICIFFFSTHIQLIIDGGNELHIITLNYLIIKVIVFKNVLK